MTPLALFTAALTLAAPPPKPVANAGRITLWVGDKLEHFRPDGGDVLPFAIPDGVTLPEYGFTLSSDRKTAIYLDHTGSNPNAGSYKSRLVIVPIAADRKPFKLEDYVATRAILSDDGKKVFFTGAKGDELDTTKNRGTKNFVFDVETKKVEPLSLPENHNLEAVSPDGQMYVTSRTTTDNNTYSRRNYLVPADGKPVEVFKENVFAYQQHFSADGTKLLAQSQEYTDMQPLGNGAFRVAGSKPREYVVLEIASKKISPLKNIPAEGYVSGVAWSPDGTQIAYVHYDPQSRVGQAAPPPGMANIRSEHEFKVFVADADGGNPKEVYKSKGYNVRAFMWK